MIDSSFLSFLLTDPSLNISPPKQDTNNSIKGYEFYPKDVAELRKLLSGTTYCITGKVPGFDKKWISEHLSKAVNLQNTKYTESITLDTSILLVFEKETNKDAKAVKYGIPRVLFDSENIQVFLDFLKFIS